MEMQLARRPHGRARMQLPAPPPPAPRSAANVFVNYEEEGDIKGFVMAHLLMCEMPDLRV